MGALTREEARVQEQQQALTLIERKKTLARLLCPQDTEDPKERMRLHTLWIQFVVCLKCGTGWGFHTEKEECTCKHILPLQLKEVKEASGAIPGLEDP